MLKNTFLNNNDNMGEFLFVLHKSCVFISGCCKVPIRRSRYKSKPSSSEVIRFTQNFVLLKHCWNCRCHQADGHRQSQDSSRFRQPSISVISSGDPFFLQSCVTPTLNISVNFYFTNYVVHFGRRCRLLGTRIGIRGIVGRETNLQAWTTTLPSRNQIWSTLN